MSLSINHLLGAFGASKNAPPPETQLYNPDIPDSENFDKNKIVKDQAYNNWKLPTRPRNGGNFMLPRAPLENPRLDGFNVEGAIDPNEIRRRIDPKSATANTFAFGNKGAEFELPDTAFEEHDNISLIQKARKSYITYQNRFSMDQGTPNNPNVQQ